MEIIYGCCCGIDVHKNKLAVCILEGTGRKRKSHYLETGTTTKELLELADTLKKHSVEKVAMESTGPYWKPLFNILEEEDIPAIVVNAAHMKNVPGRKTDQKDAEWIADLLQHGLLRPSFIPDREHRDLRDIIIYRRKAVETRSSEVNRIQKTFEAANIKLGSYISDITGKSGLRLLEALVRGESLDAKHIAELKAKKEIASNLKAQPDKLAEACDGRLSKAQRILLGKILEHIRYLDQTIADMNDLIDDLLTSDEHTGADLLTTMPGIDARSARTIIGIIGDNLEEHFPSADHFCAWAGLVPGNNESAGKRKNCRTRQGHKCLKSTLITCAHAAVKYRGSFFKAKYDHLVRRKGKKKAIVAVAHAMAKAIYHMLTKGEEFRDLGPEYYEQRNKESKINYLVRKLRELGWQPADAAVAAT